MMERCRYSGRRRGRDRLTLCSLLTAHLRSKLSIACSRLLPLFSRANYRLYFSIKQCITQAQRSIIMIEVTWPVHLERASSASSSTHPHQWHCVRMHLEKWKRERKRNYSLLLSTVESGNDQRTLMPSSHLLNFTLSLSACLSLSLAFPAACALSPLLLPSVFQANKSVTPAVSTRSRLSRVEQLHSTFSLS